MATALRCACLAVLLATGLAAPAPGRIPKVYNALITSNQNLEPSKAYPVYQPVLHNTFPFPFHTVYYGDYPVSNGLLPVPGPAPKPLNPVSTPSPQSPSSESPKETEPATDSPQPVDQASSNPDTSNNATPSPPAPPKTESPIPLNEFGLPPQVLPIGRLGPTYDFTHFGSFPYAYPGLRFYDPYDPFAFKPYAGLPIYRPFTNAVGHGAGAPVIFGKTESSTPTSVFPKEQGSENPPSEPSDLNVLNYSAKDPAIPNVPPPPLPSGGLKSDKSE